MEKTFQNINTTFSGSVNLIPTTHSLLEEITVLEIENFQNFREFCYILAIILVELTSLITCDVDEITQMLKRVTGF